MPKLVSTAAEWIVLSFDTLYYTELPPYSLKTTGSIWSIGVAVPFLILHKDTSICLFPMSRYLFPIYRGIYCQAICWNWDLFCWIKSCISILDRDISIKTNIIIYLKVKISKCILTSNENATHKYTSIYQGYIKYIFTEDSWWFHEYKKLTRYWLH